MTPNVCILEMAPALFGPPVSLRYGWLGEVSDKGTQQPHLRVGEMQLPIDRLNPGAAHRLDMPLVLLSRPARGPIRNEIQVKPLETGGGAKVRTLLGIVDIGDERLGKGPFVIVDNPSSFLFKLTPDPAARMNVKRELAAAIDKHREAAVMSLFEGDALMGMVGVAPAKKPSIQTA